ncbi:MAG: outer membrane protein assembly factor BamC [Bacteroidota bacterium]
MKRAAPKLVVAFALPALLAGCSMFGDLFESKKVDYKSAGKLPTLEVPPDLTRPGRDDRYAMPENPSGTATFSQYSAERQGVRSSGSSDVLPTSTEVRIARDGNQRYIVVGEQPDKVWPVVREFWQENGFLLTVEMPDAGVMETDWAENRAKLPQDAVRNMLGKLLDQVYSTGERDKFRTRLERSPDGKGTEIFISHRGMVEQLTGRSGQYDSSMWQPRPPDPELEAEFLSRLMVRLGAEEQRSRAQVAARGGREERAKMVTVAGGGSALNVNEPFDRAWRRVGLALDRVGFTVEDRDRSKGIYYVRYVDPNKDGGTNSGGGFLAKLAFWRSTDAPAKAEQYRVTVQPGSDASQVQVLNKDGQPETGGTSKQILSLLYDQLK